MGRARGTRRKTGAEASTAGRRVRTCRTLLVQEAVVRAHEKQQRIRLLGASRRRAKSRPQLPALLRELCANDPTGQAENAEQAQLAATCTAAAAAAKHHLLYKQDAAHTREAEQWGRGVLGAQCVQALERTRQGMSRLRLEQAFCMHWGLTVRHGEWLPALRRIAPPELHDPAPHSFPEELCIRARAAQAGEAAEVAAMRALQKQVLKQEVLKTKMRLQMHTLDRTRAQGRTRAAKMARATRTW